jgi:hypothetical protein
MSSAPGWAFERRTRPAAEPQTQDRPGAALPDRERRPSVLKGLLERAGDVGCRHKVRAGEIWMLHRWFEAPIASIIASIIEAIGAARDNPV